MKRILSLILCVVMALSFSVSAFAEQIKVLIYVNDKLIENAEGRVFYGGTTFVTVRPVMEAMGLKVDWIGEEGCIKVTTEQYVIAFYINHNVLYVQDTASEKVIALKLDRTETPLISDGLAYIPLRRITSLTGASLHWEPDPKSTYITYDKNSDRGYSIETLEFMYSDTNLGAVLAEGETEEIIDTTEATTETTTERITEATTERITEATTESITEATTESTPKLVGSSNGEGTLYYPSGKVYKGTLKNGAENGTGTMTYSNGGVYTGEWVNGKRQGTGTMTYAIGDVYEGEWANDNPSGKGTMTYVNGTVYKGEWVNGRRTGTATYTYSNGNVYEGEVVNGYRQGKGKMTYADGTVKEGTWERGEFAG